MRRSFVAVVTACSVAVGLMAGTAAAQDEPTQNIVEIAQGNPDLSTLVTAVSEAGLAETLSGDGPFTVFAPTNAAFDALPAGTLDSLLADPSGELTNILQLHVISGAVDSEAAIEAAGGTVDTLGGPISVELQGSDLVVGGATVVTADIQATNGVIHVIDAVITETATPETVEAGNSGVASSGGNGLLLGLLGGVALVGVGSATAVLALNRRQD